MDRMASLEAFVRVVNEGGFAAAARSLQISPAMVSKHVNALERRLGTRLLQRTTRRIALTEPGAAFYEEARGILRALDDAEQAAAAQGGALRGTLRLAAPVAFSDRYVAPLLPAFLRRHPGLGIDLVCDDKVVDLVEGRFDMSLRIGRLPDSSLIARKLAPVDVVVCAAPSYLAERGVPERLDDLARHACLGYDYQWTAGGWAFQAEDAGRDVVVRLPRPQHRSNNAEVLRELALEGFGLVQLPTFIVAPDIAAGRLVPVLTCHPAIERWVHAVWPPGRYLPAAVRAVSDFLAVSYRPPPWEVPRAAQESGSDEARRGVPRGRSADPPATAR